MGDVVGMDGVPVGAAAPVDGVRAFDQDGRGVIVPREQWREHVLPGMLRQVWDDPDQLSMLLVNSVQDGFLAEIVEAAEHLYLVDPVKARGTSLWGIVLLQSGRIDEAEAVLAGFAEKDGSVLANLARVYEAQGEIAKANATLWRALKADPNLDHAVAWYLSKANETGGDAEVLAALHTLAALPNSWVAWVGLASRAVREGEIERAKDHYNKALAGVKGLGLPAVPGQLLMQMSGDLGAAGRIAELVELTAPHFVPEMHGLPVGNNLIKAFCDLGNLDAAAEIVKVLASFERVEWKQPLAAWEREIDRLRGAELEIGMLRVDGPVWLPAGSPGWQLFGSKANADVAVTFLGGTAEGSPDAAAEKVDLMGRLSRALPLFFAEQVELRTAANGRAMLPWAVGRQSGFVVSGQAWTDEQAVAAAVSSHGGVPSTYVVSVHVDASEAPWTAELAFVRVSDRARIGELFAEFAPESPESGLQGLAQEMVELLEAVAPGAGTASGRYVVPEGEAFAGYLVRLEQLLGVRCASMDVGKQTPGPGFLHGEQGILEALLASCEAMPANVPLRLLLIETMSAMHRVRPELVEGYRAKVDALMVERPIG